jgi:hypothetical protein
MYNCYFVLSSLIAAVPALYCHAELNENALAALKADPAILKALFSEGVIAEEGDDAQLRPRYVGTQAAFEQYLTQELVLGSIKRVVAVIHTPLPATPVCTAGEITPDLVDPSMLNDEKRLQTVRERPSIIRALLQTGGTVMIAYPAVAKEQRSQAQLAIYQDLLDKYQGNLLDVPMGCLEVAPEMVGATYLYETSEGKWCTFSIRFTQAIAPSTPCQAAMWLGDIEKGPASERLAQVSAYLQACQGPNLLINAAR